MERLNLQQFKSNVFTANIQNMGDKVIKVSEFAQPATFRFKALHVSSIGLYSGEYGGKAQGLPETAKEKTRIFLRKEKA